MKKNTIMIVEDESIIALNIKETLHELGYGVLGIASNIQKALALLEKATPDLILMDVFLKDGDNGAELAKIIKQKYAIPIIFLTANSELQTIAHAGESAPYGYLVKPFKATDLQSNIEIALRRFQQDQAQKAQFDKIKNLNVSLKTKIQKDAAQSSQLVALKDGYMFDRREKSLYNGEEIIPLTQREKKVMDTLCANVGHVTSIEQIETAVWSDHPAGYAALRSLLFRLRLKLPEGMITNASGSGYKIHQ